MGAERNLMREWRFNIEQWIIKNISFYASMKHRKSINTRRKLDFFAIISEDENVLFMTFLYKSYR